MSNDDERSAPSPVAVITGGAGGMGLATAKLMGRDHRVVIADVNPERLAVAAKELQDQGVAAESVLCDVTDRAAVESLAATAASLGTVVSVVHTAGVSPSMATAPAIVTINALGTIHVTEAFLPLAGPGFALVNVASTAGHVSIPTWILNRMYEVASVDADLLAKRLVSFASLGPRRLRPGAAYALSKNFVIWYSRRQAATFGERDARILSVSPGSFDTEMGRLEMDSGAGEFARHGALQRFGDVDEIAEVLAFCAGRKASYLTGTDIIVDGGSSAAMTLKATIAMARMS